MKVKQKSPSALRNMFSTATELPAIWYDIRDRPINSLDDLIPLYESYMHVYMEKIDGEDVKVVRCRSPEEMYGIPTRIWDLLCSLKYHASWRQDYLDGGEGDESYECSESEDDSSSCYESEDEDMSIDEGGEEENHLSITLRSGRYLIPA